MGSQTAETIDQDSIRRESNSLSITWTHSQKDSQHKQQSTKSSDSIECETKKSNALKMMKSFVLDSESRSDKCSESQIIDEVLLIDEEKENERNLLLQQMSNDANDHSSEDEIFQHPENEKYVKKKSTFCSKKCN